MRKGKWESLVGVEVLNGAGKKGLKPFEFGGPLKHLLSQTGTILPAMFQYFLACRISPNQPRFGYHHGFGWILPNSSSASFGRTPRM